MKRRESWPEWAERIVDAAFERAMDVVEPWLSLAFLAMAAGMGLLVVGLIVGWFFFGVVGDPSCAPGYRVIEVESHERAPLVVGKVVTEAETIRRIKVCGR